MPWEEDMAVGSIFAIAKSSDKFSKTWQYV